MDRTTVGGHPATEVRLEDVELGDVVWTRFQRSTYVNYSRLGTALRLLPARADALGNARYELHFIDSRGKQRYRTLKIDDTVFIEGYVHLDQDGV